MSDLISEHLLYLNGSVIILFEELLNKAVVELEGGVGSGTSAAVVGGN